GLKVVIRGSRVTPGTPLDVSTRFGGAADPSRVANLVYPADGVLLPPNLGAIEFQWMQAGETDLFDLYFTSPFIDFHVYTTTPKYTPTAEEWTWLSETHRGAAVNWSVRASTQAGGGVGTSSTQKVEFAPKAVHGAVYYWSSTNDVEAEGIWRFDFG